MPNRRAALIRTGGLALSLALAACEHAAPLDPAAGGHAPPPVLLTAIPCAADLSAHTVVCGDGASGSAGSAATPSLVYGGQGFNVRVQSSNALYDPASSAFTFDVTVQNLLPQPIGTRDGTTPDAEGVRIFMTADPAVTSGNGGTVTPMPDGRATFTASSQAYWLYDGAALGSDGILASQETSAARQWRLDVAGQVNTFTFTVYVSAAMPQPDGWMTVSPSSLTLAAGDSAVVTASAAFFDGISDPFPVTWTSSDSSVAVVRRGRVFARAAGSATLTASEGPRRGSLAVTVPVASARLQRVSGDGFSAKVLDTARLTVRAVDANGAPLPGTIVNFAVSGPAPHCTYSQSCPAASLSLTSATADSLGYVSTVLHLGTSSGSHTVTASAAGMPSSQFTGIATPDQVCSALLSSGGSAFTGDSLPVVSFAQDQFGNAVAWSPGALGTRGGANGYVYVSTIDINSYERGWWVLGPTVGTQQQMYTGYVCLGTGYPSPMTPRAQTYVISATATSTQSVIAKASADSVQVTAGTGSSLVARVQDYHGNALAGVVVTWTVSSGGGTLSATSDTSDASGLVQATLTTGAAPGTNTVTASATGLASTTFTVFGIDAASASVAATRGSGQVAVASSLLPDTLWVRVTDAGGTALPGRTVTWSTPNGGAFSRLDATTDANGYARALWRLGTGSGAQTATATLQGGTGNSATFTASALVFTRVAGGGTHACGLTSGGVAWCWGYNAYGQLGTGNTTDAKWPTRVVTNERFTEIVTGQLHTCALRTDGAAFCWGYNATGQLGTGDVLSSTTPRTVAGGHTFTAIGSQMDHSCAIDGAGMAWCWGTNWIGELGKGTASASCPSTFVPCETQPVAVAGGHQFTQVAAGGSGSYSAHSCAIDTAGAAWCWGAATSGALGYDASGLVTNVPRAVTGGLQFTRISAGGTGTCAVAQDGGGYCWGGNEWGELGTGGADDADHVAPARVPGLTFTEISRTESATCALASGGAAWCWGSNAGGALGTSAVTSPCTANQGVACTGSPAAVAGSLTFTRLQGGREGTCAMTADARAFCWGPGTIGQVGNGSASDAYAPTRVGYIAPPAGLFP